ncbi:hypothetical protein niasHS_011342 [Heterodera schachtii]|uniref:Uncharacterized protein n=1 Tax=Heterodera schachtii TaxID=97005 RepID=A0ABD2IN55_HETSC
MKEERKRNVDLEYFYKSKKFEGPKNIKNGQNIELEIDQQHNAKDESIEKVHLQFYIFIKPFGRDELPLIGHSRVKMAPEGWLLRRFFTMAVIWPNPSKRYVISLGRIDPPGLYWNRKLMVDQKNDHGTYHALLYANTIKIGRTENSEEKMLLGYAKLEKVYDQNEPEIDVKLKEPRPLGEEILGEHGEEQAGDLGSGRKPKNVGGAESGSSEALKHENEQITEIHNDGKGKITHQFHNECIKNWFAQNKICCPLCMMEANLVLSSTFNPMFTGPSKFGPNLYMDPIGELLQIINNKKHTNEFNFNQAKEVIDQYLINLHESVDEIRVLFSQLNIIGIDLDEFLTDQNIREGISQTMIDQLRKNVLDQLISKLFNGDKVDYDIQEVINYISDILKQMQSLRIDRMINIKACKAIENMGMIREEEEKDEKFV